MKKIIITGILLLSAILFAGAQQSFAYQNVTSSPDGGCLQCHPFAGGAGTGHTTHSGASVGCSSCHPSGTPGKNVTTAKCIVCHPTGNVGKCNLINLATHPKSGAQSCLTCHATCAPTTTTIPAGSCIDTDNDTYGDNCTAGPDCDDADPAIHEGCEIDCTLKVTPRTFSKLRALIEPFQFFAIRADRDSSISFSNPTCIFWESEGIDDVIKIRLGEKLIIGYVRVWASHLTDGDFKVSVTFGDTVETQCGPITVRGGEASSYIQPNLVKLQNKCGK